MKEVFRIVNIDPYENDIEINFVFSTKKKAKQFIQRCEDNNKCLGNGRRYNGELEIEEGMVVDPPLPPKHVTMVEVIMSKRGASSGRAIERPTHQLGFSPYCIHGKVSQLVYYVKGDSEEAAIKVVDKIRLKILEAGVWGDEERTRTLLAEEK